MLSYAPLWYLPLWHWKSYPHFPNGHFPHPLYPPIYSQAYIGSFLPPPILLGLDYQVRPKHRQILSCPPYPHQLQEVWPPSSVMDSGSFPLVQSPFIPLCPQWQGTGPHPPHPPLPEQYAPSLSTSTPHPQTKPQAICNYPHPSPSPKTWGWLSRPMSAEPPQNSHGVRKAPCWGCSFMETGGWTLPPPGLPPIFAPVYIPPPPTTRWPPIPPPLPPFPPLSLTYLSWKPMPPANLRPPMLPCIYQFHPSRNCHHLYHLCPWGCLLCLPSSVGWTWMQPLWILHNRLQRWPICCSQHGRRARHDTNNPPGKHRVKRGEHYFPGQLTEEVSFFSFVIGRFPLTPPI